MADFSSGVVTKVSRDKVRCFTGKTEEGSRLEGAAKGESKVWERIIQVTAGQSASAYKGGSKGAGDIMIVGKEKERWPSKGPRLIGAPLGRRAAKTRLAPK